MKKHTVALTRTISRPAPAFSANEVAKYIGETLSLANSLLGAAHSWQDLRDGKGSAQG